MGRPAKVSDIFRVKSLKKVFRKNRKPILPKGFGPKTFFRKLKVNYFFFKDRLFFALNLRYHFFYTKLTQDWSSNYKYFIEKFLINSKILY